MPIKDYEYYHGAVLTKILRKDIPTSLKLVETNVKESWCTYKINDAVTLYIKYSSQIKAQKNIRWTFLFTQRHLSELKRYVNDDLRFALVCLGDEAKDCKPEICLLYKEQVMGLIDFNSITEQRINVYAEKNCELKVDGTMSPKSKQISVKRSEIDSMIIPG